MPLKDLVAILVITLSILSGCASTAADNTTYSQPQGMGPDAVVGGDRSDGTGPGSDLVD